MRTRLAITVGAVAIAVAGCGATPPQAPLAQAKKLDAATSGIASACGLSYQTTALADGHQPDLSALESTAITEARKLASVYALNPDWIYQSETIRVIVHDSISALGDCRLTEAQATLAAQTGHRGSG
jgi:hypothetical protein